MRDDKHTSKAPLLAPHATDQRQHRRQRLRFRRPPHNANIPPHEAGQGCRVLAAPLVLAAERFQIIERVVVLFRVWICLEREEGVSVVECVGVVGEGLVGAAVRRVVFAVAWSGCERSRRGGSG